MFIRVDMPDRVIAGNDIPVPAAGMRINFTPRYKELQGLGLSIQNRASGDRESVTAKDETGFNIRIFNSTGVGVAKTVDYVSKGYGREVT